MSSTMSEDTNPTGLCRSGVMMSHDYTSQSTDENPRMMAFFDSLVQREIEGWSSSDDEGNEPLRVRMDTSPSATVVEVRAGQLLDCS